MLSRFDHVEGAGLYGLAGFIELDDRTPVEVAKLILQRLALNENRQQDYYLTTNTGSVDLDWPEVAPVLDWPVADHADAQRTFSNLITRNAPFRLMSIQGESETGKSHLTKQFLRNALKIRNITCARFDFKGSSDIDEELRAFAENLSIKSPTASSSVRNQLAQIFTSLKEIARPTLFIFDTFESAGDAERWVKESLLLTLIRSPWLRVIIVGKQVPNNYGEPWADISSKMIGLQPPTPQEWFEYGLLHKSDITLDFVHKAHACCGGKSTVLAQLLGPGL